MLAVVLGLHGPLTNWCCDALAWLLRSRGETPVVARLNALEDFTVELLTGRSSLVVVSTRPAPKLISALRRADIPYVVVDEEPTRSALFRMQQLKESHVNAVRGVLAETVALHGAVASPLAFRVDRGRAAADTTAELRRIGRHLRILPDASSSPVADTVAALPVELASLFAGTRSSEPETVLDETEIPVEERLVIKAALQELGTFEGDDKSRVLLMRDFFHSSDTGAPAVSGQIDVTGRARLLAQGPHVFLAAGAWRARSVHRFSADLAGTPFTIDAVAWVNGIAHGLARTTFTVPTSGGVVEAVLNFTVMDPWSIIEMRLFAEKAIFAGSLGLGYVDVVRSRPQDDVLAAIDTDERSRGRAPVPAV